MTLTKRLLFSVIQINNKNNGGGQTQFSPRVAISVWNTRVTIGYELAHSSFLTYELLVCIMLAHVRIGRVMRSDRLAFSPYVRAGLPTVRVCTVFCGLSNVVKNVCTLCSKCVPFCVYILNQSRLTTCILYIEFDFVLFYILYLLCLYSDSDLGTWTRPRTQKTHMGEYMGEYQTCETAFVLFYPTVATYAKNPYPKHTEDPVAA